MLTHKQAETRVEHGFWAHFAIYLMVAGGLVALNFSRHPDQPWSMWLAAGWGLGVAVHALALLIPESRARMITRTILRMDRRQSRLARTAL